MNRENLISAYAERIVEDMDIKTMSITLEEFIKGNLDKYTDDQLATEISESYPDLLEE